MAWPNAAPLQSDPTVLAARCGQDSERQSRTRLLKWNLTATGGFAADHRSPLMGVAKATRPWPPHLPALPCRPRLPLCSMYLQDDTVRHCMLSVLSFVLSCVDGIASGEVDSFACWKRLEALFLQHATEGSADGLHRVLG